MFNSYDPQDDDGRRGGSFERQMEVRLKVRDAAGNASVVTVNANVKVLPNQQCGFSF